MPDTFRFVTIDRGGRARLVADLNDSSNLGSFRERDTFVFTPPERRDRVVPSDNPYQGGTVIRGPHDNASGVVTVNVRRSTPAAAAAAVEEVLDVVEEARRDGLPLYLEWKAEGLARSVYFPILGPGKAVPSFRSRVWAGSTFVPVAITLPLAPLAEGLPMSVDHRFGQDVPPDKAGGRVNLVTNPGAELDLSGWDGQGDTLARQTTTVSSGTAAFSITKAGAGGSAFILYAGGAAGFDNPHYMPVTAGLDYAASAAFRAAVTTRNVTVTLAFYDSDGTKVGSTASAPVSSSSGAWTRASVVATAPAGAVTARVTLSVQSMALAEVHYFDDVLVEQASSAGTYVDGDSASFRWAGLVGQSRSVELVEDALAEWTVDSGIAVDQAGDPAGPIEPGLTSGDGTALRLRHTGRGYTVADPSVVVLFALPSSLPNAAAKVEVGKALGGTSNSNVRAELSTTNGSTWTLALIVTDGGSTTITSTAPSLTAGGVYALRIDFAGRLAQATLWTVTGGEAKGSAGFYGVGTATATLAFTDVGQTTPLDVNAGVAGLGEAFIGVQQTTAYLRGIRILRALIEPYSFPAVNGWREAVLRGVPGNAPARFDFETAQDTGGTVPFALVSAWRRPRRNLLLNGDAELTADHWWKGGAGNLNVNVAADGSATLARVASGGPGDAAFIRYTGSASNPANAGFGYRTVAPLVRGRVYTVEFAYRITAGQPVEWALYTGGTARIGFTALTLTSGWNVVRRTFTLASDATPTLELLFRKAAATTAATIEVARPRVYEGEPADQGETNQRAGRGGQPAAGLLFPEQHLPSLSSNVVTTTTGSPSPTGQALGFGQLHNASQNSGYAAWLIDPSLIAFDDEQDQTLEVEVYAFVETSASGTYGNAQLTLSARPYNLAANVAPIFTPEWGSAGRALGAPASSGSLKRVVRLGTLTLPRELVRDGRTTLRLDVTLGGSPAPNASSALRVWHLLAVPIRRRASSPTGKDWTTSDATGTPQSSNTYPVYSPYLGAAGAGNATVKRVSSDLRGELGRLSLRDFAADVGLGGAPLRMDPGENVLLAYLLASGIPDNTGTPNANTAVGFPSGVSVVARVTPRYRFWRDS